MMNIVKIGFFKRMAKEKSQSNSAAKLGYMYLKEEYDK